ncbi:sensor histidine kinase [Escherichia coli]|uniref:Sensor histidine kinase n=1 Tax=Escherichia coli TaxID=562 RepID=A0A2X3JKD6_ECOLX|nr:sensor histidine kinase [Escherichia coli]
MRQGFNEVNSMKVAQVLYQELDIGAVAITDREKLLAFTGIGDDHHLPGKPISSTYTLKAIETGEVVYADGNEVTLSLLFASAMQTGVDAGNSVAWRKSARDGHHQIV